MQNINIAQEKATLENFYENPKLFEPPLVNHGKPDKIIKENGIDPLMKFLLIQKRDKKPVT